MRLDTHLHVMLKPFYGRQPTNPEKLISDLNECGLNGGWVSAIDSMVTRDLCTQKKANDSLAKMTQKYRGCLEGFCTIDPSGMEEAAYEVESGL